MESLKSKNEQKEAPGRYPDFLIIGAAKSGTTSLYQALNMHPHVFMPCLKEPEFFSSDAIYQRGTEWYRSLFSSASINQICGEASTTYSRWPHTRDAAKTIAGNMPNSKFIYIIRDPIERAYSHYAHHMRTHVTMTFEEALEKSNIYIDCSMYLMQIERYLRFFPKHQFLFLLLNDLSENFEKTMAKIHSFLNLHPLPEGAQLPIVANVSGADHYIRKRTTMRLRRIPGISFAADRAPLHVRQYIYAQIRDSSLGKYLAQKAKIKPMRPETQEKLTELFNEPNKQLERFLSRDLSHWSGS